LRTEVDFTEKPQFSKFYLNQIHQSASRILQVI